MSWPSVQTMSRTDSHKSQIDMDNETKGVVQTCSSELPSSHLSGLGSSRTLGRKPQGLRQANIHVPETMHTESARSHHRSHTKLPIRGKPAEQVPVAKTLALYFLPDSFRRIRTIADLSRPVAYLVAYHTTRNPFSAAMSSRHSSHAGAASISGRSNVSSGDSATGNETGELTA